MRKFVVTAAAMLLTFGFAAPAEAAAVGQSCKPSMAIVKVGTAKLYCGKNTSKATQKSRPLVWKRSVDCYDLIVAYSKVKRDYDSAIKQISDIKTQIAAVQGDTSGLQATVKSFEDTVKVFEPTVMAMRGQVQSLCS